MLATLLGRAKSVDRDPEVRDAVAASHKVLARNASLVAELSGVERALKGRVWAKHPR